MPSPPPVSVHTLRHTVTSMMKNSGVSSAVVEEFVGHDSKEMNRVYTHIDFQTLKKAAEGFQGLVDPMGGGQMIIVRGL